ncbi:MAG: hypothetical protein V1913_05185 [Fibrobacterota bacterium]
MKKALRLLPVLLLTVVPALWAQPPALQEREEVIAKEQALLDLKKRALQEEIDRFEKERGEWKRKQETEILLRNTEGLDADDLDPEARKQMALCDALSKTFAGFLAAEGRASQEARQVVILFQTDADGTVVSVTFQRSEVPLETEEKIRKLLEGLDLSALGPGAANLTHRFPLLLKK